MADADERMEYWIAPVERSRKGKVTGGNLLQAISREAAIRRAEGYAARGLGAIVFSRHADADWGEEGSTQIIGVYGEVPLNWMAPANAA